MLLSDVSTSPCGLRAELPIKGTLPGFQSFQRPKSLENFVLRAQFPHSTPNLNFLLPRRTFYSKWVCQTPLVTAEECGILAAHREPLRELASRGRCGLRHTAQLGGERRQPRGEASKLLAYLYPSRCSAGCPPPHSFPGSPIPTFPPPPSKEGEASVVPTWQMVSECKKKIMGDTTACTEAA